MPEIFQSTELQFWFRSRRMCISWKNHPSYWRYLSFLMKFPFFFDWRVNFTTLFPKIYRTNVTHTRVELISKYPTEKKNHFSSNRYKKIEFILRIAWEYLSLVLRIFICAMIFFEKEKGKGKTECRKFIFTNTSLWTLIWNELRITD